MPDSAPNEPIAYLAATALDVNDLELEKTFWQAMLGVEIGSEVHGYVFFKPQQGRSAFTLQQVPEGRTAPKNRAHPDLEVPYLDEAIRKVEELGGKVIQPKPEEGFQWVVMTDPEGNEFCLVSG